MGIIKNIQSFLNIKFAITAILAASVSAGANFGGLDFLKGPKEMAEAEAARARFIAEQVAHFKNRQIKLNALFNARDVEAARKRASARFARRAKKAGSFKNLMIIMHHKAVKHHAAMKAKRESAFKRWIAARKAHHAAIRARKHAARAYSVSIRVRVAAQKKEKSRKAALAAAWKRQHRAGAAKKAARENYVKWAKAHRSAVTAKMRATIKKIKAEKAHRLALRDARIAKARHVAAVHKRAKALKAVMHAHRKLKAHAAKGIHLVL